MRTMTGEILLKIPAERAWEIYRNNEILSKIDPEMLAGAEYLEGNGDPGSLRLFRLGPALKDLVKESKEKIEKVELGWLVKYEVVGGELRDLYDPYRVTFTFSSVPEKKEEQCTVAWKAEFEPRSPAVPPPLKAKNAALSFLKSFERFQR